MTYIHSEECVLAAFADAGTGDKTGDSRESNIPEDTPLSELSAGVIGDQMVSAAGFEPATHALKGHCSTT